jgi:hypothetical protein
MSVEILDKTNTKAPRVILIDENYCLNDSFDIIQTNFETLIDALNQIEDSFYAQTVINRYNKNKTKYLEFLTYVSQFSGNWVNAVQTYEKHKNVWNNIYTPLEIVYPAIIDIKTWGSYEDSIITENTAVSLLHINNVLEWVNSRYPIQLYGLYKKINVRVYIYGIVEDNFNFGVSYTENCIPSGGGGRVCCDGCPPSSSYGNKACNHSIVNGVGTCANMYDWCPGRDRVQGFSSSHHGNSRDEQTITAKGYANSVNCADGNCQGWGYGYNSNNWKGQQLDLNGRLTGNDNRMLGYQVVKLVFNENLGKWVR